MCTITINQPQAVSSGSTIQSVTITGSVSSDCPCQNSDVTVTINCSTDPATAESQVVQVSSGNFSATFTTGLDKCGCNDKIDVTVICESPESVPISKTETFLLLCCCPEVRLDLIKVTNCEAHYEVGLQIPDGCPDPVTVEISYGDGNSESYTFTGSGVETFLHSYGNTSPQVFTVNVNVLSPIECQPASISQDFNIPACSISDCCPEVSLKLIQVVDCEAHFEVEVIIPDGCDPPAMVEILYGDGDDDSGVYQVSGVQTFSHNYGNSNPQSYTVTINVLWPSGCPAISKDFTIQACTGLNCCPEVREVNVEALGCEDEDCDCEQKIKLSTILSLPDNESCYPITVHWDLGGSSSPPDTIYSYGGGTHIYETEFCMEPGTQNIALEFSLRDHECSSYPFVLEVPACPPKVPCPAIEASVEVGEICNGDCMKKVEFTCLFQIDFGCGTNTVEIKFSDGQGGSVSYPVTGSGSVSIPFLYSEYYSPGSYTATVEILSPSGCDTLEIPFVVDDCPPPPCPDITLTPIIEEECIDCRRVVTLRMDIAAGPVCKEENSIIVDLDFGNGHIQSQAYTLSDGIVRSQSISFPWQYEPGNYQATAIVNSPAGCPDTVVEFEVPECEEPECCQESGCLAFLCPIFRLLGILGIAFGLFFFIINSCSFINVPIWIPIVLLAIGILCLILYAIFCPCKPCGWLWILLWQTFLGLGLLLLIFGDCCNFWIWGLILVAVSFLWLWIWRRRCDVDRCDILRELLWMWTVLIVPIVGFLTDTPWIENIFENCLFIIFNGFSLFAAVTLIFALITAFFMANCIRR